MPLAQARALIDAHGFATLTDDRLRVSHLPLVLARDEGELGTLYGHLARANPHGHELEGRRVLAVFNGPHGYVSPHWYAAGPAVPTWHYAVVHARGIVECLDDAATLASLDALVARYEPDLLDDATLMSEAYRCRLLAGVVGFRIRLDELQGTAKLGQHRSRDDRASVLAGLGASDDPLARQLGRYTERYDQTLFDTESDNEH
ncbi:FMN-binding negative transcriptional regulator [Halomonas getboli]|uniref:FMN-binding negative transcriptional regulator n=1 Tax=Halomonas getboli TaxID=2935862 RepID=UPI001FFFD2AE|nr:FMN-binding negative transcriptional regulator [Halomonas getboli]MCK2184710.1 FMN-binding negative transcriptional regulator [Halomonas getboli]